MGYSTENGNKIKTTWEVGFGVSVRDLALVEIYEMPNHYHVM